MLGKEGGCYKTTSPLRSTIFGLVFQMWMVLISLRLEVSYSAMLESGLGIKYVLTLGEFSSLRPIRV